jgi:hypothetical protein
MRKPVCVQHRVERVDPLCREEISMYDLSVAMNMDVEKLDGILTEMARPWRRKG